MGHQISRHEDCPIFKHFEIWYPILICLYLGSRISYRKVFVLQTKLWIPTFQWNMSQLSSMFVAREIKQIPCGSCFVGHRVSYQQIRGGWGVKTFTYNADTRVMGPKKEKTCWHNTWTLPYFLDGWLSFGVALLMLTMLTTSLMLRNSSAWINLYSCVVLTLKHCMFPSLSHVVQLGLGLSWTLK